MTLAESQSGTADSTDWALCVAPGKGPQAADADFKTIANGGFVTSANGYDIRPYADSALTTPLVFELVPGVYNASTGGFEIWVKIPTLSASTDTVIYMAFGDAGITTDGTSTSTWDTAFKGVWHFPDGTTLGLLDSTGVNNGSTGGFAAATGQVDGGAANDVNTEFINAGTDTSLAIGTDITVEWWINPTALTASGNMIGRTDSSGNTKEFDFYLDASGTGKVTEGGTGSVATTGITAGAWNYAAWTRSSTTGTHYLNGATNGSGTVTTRSTSSEPTYFGRRYFSTLLGTPGTMDEVRISNSARSASWITANYNSQKASSTFITWGSKVAVGGVTTHFLSLTGVGT